MKKPRTTKSASSHTIKVSDYILNFLVSQGVKDVFLITGGAIAFVVDAFHKRRDIRYICVAHEQAGAMMAESYSRLGPGLSAAMATSGPGATNLITGMGCAWFDSIPALYITGQVNTYEQKGNSKVRQVGFQETDIVEMVKPITKFAVQLDKAENIREVLEKATYIAKSGRPGPVLVDIPMNFQRTEINPKKLKGFAPPKQKEYKDTHSLLDKKIKTVSELLQEAERPVVMVGGGVRLSGAVTEMLQLIKALGVPVVTSWSGKDAVAFNNPYLIGAHGVYGERAANFAVQNSDVLVTVGSRLDTRQTGGRVDTFARGAKVVMVDIDQSELDKRRGMTPYVSINCDAKEFIKTLLKAKPKVNMKQIAPWLKTCREWKKKYPIVLPEYYNAKNYVDPYVFTQVLSEELDKNAVVIPDDGGHLTWTMQAFKVKQGQRLFSAFGNSPMGYAFPASIGASIAMNKKEVICIDGDGSMQINIQELQTLAYHKLPVKVFILNNHGYGIIKQFQELYLGSRYEATGDGYSSPDFIKVASAYGIKSVSIKNHKELRAKIKKILKMKGPVIIDVLLKPLQKLIPKLEFGRPIEDLSPLLPREEFKKNMFVKEFGQDKNVVEAN